MNIRKYLSVYKEHINCSLSESLSFRVNFVLVIFVDLVFYLISLSTVDILFQNVAQIGVWRREEFLFYVSFFLVIDNLHMSLISENFWNFSDDLKKGNLDFKLLRPVASIFQVFFSFVRIPSLVISILPWGIMVYFAVSLELTWLDWFMLPLLVWLGFLLIIGIEILISMLNFLTTEGMGVNFLRMNIQALARWPDFIYQGVFRKIFTFGLPIVAICSAPTHFLFSDNDWSYLIYLVSALTCVWVPLLLLWQRATLAYDSASS